MQESDIERVTKVYWDCFEPSQIDEAMHWYVLEGQKQLDDKSLLEAELDYARSKGRLPEQDCKTLVLLVGYSLEPLLQSVCAYTPQKVMLILNEDGYLGEGWDVFADHVKEAIGLLVEKGLLTKQPELPGEDGKVGYPAADKPSEVFQTLVKVLHNETNVVIDVTGGKKSMVSGAYLYAAYAGARISYVDNEYDPKNRRPYGYSCRIGELDNPYQTFSLREWERVRALYRNYQFREARRVLQAMSPAMTEVMPKSAQPIRTLQDFLGFYERWDSGNYRGAKQFASEQNLPSFEQPSAVTELGDRWFEISGNDFTSKPTHFYGDMDAVRVYVADELARIRRLIDYSEDYRSAFLRAGSVNEIVMLARVVSLVSDEQDKSSLLDALDQRTPEARRVFKALVQPDKTYIDVQKDIPFKGAPGLQISRPSIMQPWWKKTKMFSADDGWDTFLTRRNELIHKFFSVPREWAEDAWRFVQANFEDFLGHPLEGLNLRAKALSWPELCTLTGIDQFLPPNLRKEA